MNIPEESTLRRLYVPKAYEQAVLELKQRFDGKFIWCAMDELTDVTGRAVFAVVAGIMDPTCFHKPFVIHVEEMSEGIKTKNLCYFSF